MTPGLSGAAVPPPTLFDVALVFAYPAQSGARFYNYALYFIAVTFGVVCGTWYYHRQGFSHRSGRRCHGGPTVTCHAKRRQDAPSICCGSRWSWRR